MVPSMNIALHSLPQTLPQNRGVELSLQDGILIFRASSEVRDRVHELVEKEKVSGLSADEKQELDAYEEIDDYLSSVNRLIRNSTVSGEIPLAS